MVVAGDVISDLAAHYFRRRRDATALVFGCAAV
jgi:hypothetical protein